MAESTEPSSSPLSNLGNPLAEICRRMGFDVSQAGRYAGVGMQQARDALSDTPSATLAAAFRIMEGIGASIRVKASPAMRVWIDLAHLDRIYFDDAVRTFLNLPLLPKTKKELRSYIRRLRRWREYSYSQIVEHFEKGHVCSFEGNQNWRRGTIGQILNSRKRKWVDDADPVLPNDGAKQTWRDWLINELRAKLIPGDAMAFVRFRFNTRVDEAERKLWWETEGNLPAKAREWILGGLKAAEWLKWGEEKSVAE